MYRINDPKAPRVCAIPTIFGSYVLVAVLQSFDHRAGDLTRWNMRLVLGPSGSANQPLTNRGYPGKGLIRDASGYSCTDKPCIIINPHGRMPKSISPLIADPDFDIDEQPKPYAWSKMSVKLALPRIADLSGHGAKNMAVRMAVENRWSTVDIINPVFRDDDYVYETRKGPVARHAMLTFAWMILCRNSLATETPYEW